MPPRVSWALFSFAFLSGHGEYFGSRCKKKKTKSGLRNLLCALIRRRENSLQAAGHGDQVDRWFSGYQQAAGGGGGVWCALRWFQLRQLLTRCVSFIRFVNFVHIFIISIFTHLIHIWRSVNKPVLKHFSVIRWHFGTKSRVVWGVQRPLQGRTWEREAMGHWLVLLK